MGGARCLWWGGHFGKAGSSPSCASILPTKHLLPKDIMPRPSGPAWEDIAAGSFEILQGNGWENPFSTLPLGTITAVYFMVLLICWGGGRTGGRRVLGRRAGPPTLWRGSSHTCPPCPPAPCLCPQPSWGQLGQGHPRGSRAEGAPLGIYVLWDRCEPHLMLSATDFTTVC